MGKKDDQKAAHTRNNPMITVTLHAPDLMYLDAKVESGEASSISHAVRLCIKKCRELEGT